MNVRAIEEHGASPLRKRRAVGQPGTASLPKSIVRAVLRSSCATFRVYRTCCSRARDIVRRGHRQRQERERERKKEREGEGRCEEATAGCARREEKKREEKRREEKRRDETRREGNREEREDHTHRPRTALHATPPYRTRGPRKPVREKERNACLVGDVVRRCRSSPTYMGTRRQGHRVASNDGTYPRRPRRESWKPWPS